MKIQKKNWGSGGRGRVGGQGGCDRIITFWGKFKKKIGGGGSVRGGGGVGGSGLGGGSGWM